MKGEATQRYAADAHWRYSACEEEGRGTVAAKGRGLHCWYRGRDKKRRPCKTCRRNPKRVLEQLCIISQFFMPPGEGRKNTYELWKALVAFRFA